MKQITADTKSQPASYRLAYFIYLILVVYQLFMGEYEWAISNFGIAMVFDQFDTSVKLNDRPLYQRVWLYTHLALTVGGFAFLLFH
ncbi:MAG: hypothetical protein WKF89_14375 [Chitinophagaceae bacterium]